MRWENFKRERMRSGTSHLSRARQVVLPILLSLPLLPGSTGATLLPPPERADDPLRITLPPPMSLEGRVTVGGARIEPWRDNPC